MYYIFLNFLLQLFDRKSVNIFVRIFVMFFKCIESRPRFALLLSMVVCVELDVSYLRSKSVYVATSADMSAPWVRVGNMIRVIRAS